MSAMDSFFFSSRRRHTRYIGDWSSDVSSSDLEEEVEGLLDVPVLGSVEALPRGTQLATSQKGRERFGDMYGLLAANVAHDTDGDRAVVIAVTSATAREGKTTTASNLATALARRNARVVL